MKTLPLIFALLISVNLSAQKFQDLAQTPPMGWNSWNHFECDDINEKVVKEVADAMVSSGMKDAGYQYINIDDCWQVGRDANGKIIVDSIKFPNGIKHLADYIHGKGLKFGIYSDAGTHTCGGRPGSKGYEMEDAESYADWTVDYLKYDWCNTEGQEPVASYTLMRDAIRAAGRPIVFSICDWGYSKPWEWAGEVGHLWRTTLDITDRWDGTRWGNQLGWTDILEKQVGLEKYAGSGHWNDPDMLEVGNDGLSINEARAHFTMWCMLAAPLITGNDLRNMSNDIRNILTNENLIALDQDVLGRQGFKIYDEGNFEIWQKPLAGGDIAICLLNLENIDKAYSIEWANIKIKEYSGKYEVKNLWQDKIIGNSETSISVSVPARDVLVYRLLKSK
ncbi:MAG: glycoside hydrolase family 27 protein [Bacteroidetes bacterium]|nr:MAG: glycoside hydrolase family 27 protein [Bacteroidota bacterium]